MDGEAGTAASPSTSLRRIRGDGPCSGVVQCDRVPWLLGVAAGESSAKSSVSLNRTFLRSVFV